jgi:hypothetical protein
VAQQKSERKINEKNKKFLGSLRSLGKLIKCNSKISIKGAALKRQTE